MDSIIIFCAKYLLVFVVVGLGIVWLRLPNKLKLQMILATILAGLVAFVLSRIADKLYYDPRPFVSLHVKPLVAHAPDNGFPSDHALFTMTLTALAYFYSKKIAYAMLALTVLVGIARVLAKVHSPVDIAAGWVIGIIGVVVGYYLVNWFWQKKFSQQKTE